ncbi:MAG TPA: flagellar basal body-associated FliL family protein [Planctomycetaceae bacterium]
MAAEVAEQPKPAETAAPDAPAPRGRPKKWLVVGAIVLIVVIVQVVVTSLLLPARAPADAGAKHEDKEHEHSAADQHHGEAENDGEFAEVSMGDFSFSNGTAAPGMIIHVDFKLAAVATSKQASSLDAQLKLHQARVRQAVNKIVRMSSLEELNDPNLATIKRLIREDINRLLRKSYVLEVVITDVRTMEQ